MIEQLTGFPNNVIAFLCSGRVTRADYDSILVPAAVHALRAHEKVRLYYETGEDFMGFDAGAMWEDFRVGVEHLARWERVAVVTDVNWIKKAVRLFAFLMPATTKLFSQSKSAEARAWICA
jgi:SpoIIAA-like